MSDDATDQQKRKRGLIWYGVTALFLYVISFVPLVIIVTWFAERGWVSQHVRAGTVLLYYPIVLILASFGFLDDAEALFRRVLESLP